MFGLGLSFSAGKKLSVGPSRALARSCQRSAHARGGLARLSPSSSLPRDSLSSLLLSLLSTHLFLSPHPLLSRPNPIHPRTLPVSPVLGSTSLSLHCPPRSGSGSIPFPRHEEDDTINRRRARRDSDSLLRAVFRLSPRRRESDPLVTEKNRTALAK
jgi:hypothetical protein